MPEQQRAQHAIPPTTVPRPPTGAGNPVVAYSRRIAELEAALYAIMRVTDPGDLRSVEAREAWESVTPARKIAREALGLPLTGNPLGTAPTAGEALDAERRGQCAHHGARYFDPDVRASRCAACDQVMPGPPLNKCTCDNGGGLPLTRHQDQCEIWR